MTRWPFDDVFQVPVDHAVPLRERGVEVRMEFGGTEIAVSCYKQHDGDKLLDAKVRWIIRCHVRSFLPAAPLPFCPYHLPYPNC